MPQDARPSGQGSVRKPRSEALQDTDGADAAAREGFVRAIRLLPCSALQRLAGAAAVATLLWLGFFWATAELAKQ